jgi:hypothetical protein
MDIRIVSSLTGDDEWVVAQHLMLTIVSILKELPITYSVTVRASEHELRHSQRPSPRPNE